MRKLAPTILLAFLAVTCSNTCESGAVCGDFNSFGPTVSASPSPRPDATPDPCQIKAVKVGVFGGDQVPFLNLGQLLQLDATPVNDAGEIPKGCNVAREPSWTVLTPITCQVLSTGYNPFLRGLKVGSCAVTATVQSVISTPFTVEVR